MRRILLAGSSLLVALVVAELLVRLFVHVDDDGQRWLGEYRVLPLRLPLRQIQDSAREFDDPATVLIYDSDLGWAPRPGAKSRDGLVEILPSGVRRTAAEKLDDDTALRIVTIGDSFTFGDEVADDETWPAQLEGLLSSSGLNADVVNLGVNGYALDQAVLRFERDGVRLEPDMVILGLQPENLLRNLNVVRAIYYPGTSLPLSKPRFVTEGDHLRTVNHPTAPMEEVLEALAAPADHPLLEYESWLDARYEESLPQRSVLLSLAQSLVNIYPRGTGYELTPEMAEIGTGAIARLDAAAHSVGARLVIVHLPRKHDLEEIEAGREPWHGPWLSEVEARYDVVRPDLRPGLAEGSFQAKGHYSPRQNKHVAEAAAEYLLRDGMP